MHIKIQKQILFLTLLSGLFLSGCVKKTPIQYFTEGRFLEAGKAYEPLIPSKTDNVNYTLHRLQYASCEFEGGAYRTSDASIAECAKRMENIAAKGEVTAVIGSEYSKEYKGDPFEKEMVHTYEGLAYLRQQDYENALAAFRRALVADQDTRTPKEDQKNDFATGHYFAGVTYCLLKEPDNAQMHLNHARRFASESSLFEVAAVEKSNTFLFITSGFGPYKYAYGPGNSMVAIKKMPDPVMRIDFTCDENKMGSAVLTDDLLAEANAHGWGEMDSARLAKGIAKEIVSCIPVFSAAHNLIQSETDLRVWGFLPGDIYVWSGYIKPGLHTFALHCYNAKGAPLAQYDQIWFKIPVHDTQINVQSFRLIPYRQDIKDKVLVPCSALQPNKK